MRWLAGARPLTSDLCNLTSDAGAVAQLGERLICIQEVVGSTPIGSIPEGGCRMTDARTLASRVAKTAAGSLVKLFFDVRERCLSSDIWFAEVTVRCRCSDIGAGEGTGVSRRLDKPGVASDISRPGGFGHGFCDIGLLIC